MKKYTKTIIVTGGNSGLGLECAKNIASKSNDYQIILACRSKNKAAEAVNNLIDKTGNPNIDSMELDVSNLSSVRNFVKQYKEEGRPQIDGLICNAGINGLNFGMTSDGFDCIFETNHLGHFLLTALLLPYMKPSARISIVSSDMHNPPGDELIWLGAETLAHPDEKLSADFVRYSYSKLCNLYMTYELSRRLKRLGSEITVNALNPGLMIDTNFAPNNARFTEEFLESVADRMGSLEVSAKTLADMATEPDYEHLSGKYIDRVAEKQSSPLSYNEENALELWNMSIKYTQLDKSETFQTSFQIKNYSFLRFS